MSEQECFIQFDFKPGDIAHIIDFASGKPIEVVIVQNESTARPGWYFCRSLRRKELSSLGASSNLHCVNWASLKLFERPVTTRPAPLDEADPSGV